MREPIIALILFIGILIAGILFAICLAEPVTNSSGLLHTIIPSMRIGGDGAARLVEIGGLAFIFQCLLLVLIVCLAALGVSRRYRTKEFYLYLGASLALMIIIWWQTYTGHQRFLETGATQYFLGFPIATAWQLYGTWVGAVPLVLIYCLGFHKFIYTDADQKKFEQILKQSNRN